MALKISAEQLQKEFEMIHSDLYDFGKIENSKVAHDLDFADGYFKQYISFKTETEFKKWLTTFTIGFKVRDFNNVLGSIDNWFNIAKPIVTEQDLSVQLGCHFEEVSECMNAFNESMTGFQVERLANKYKKKNLLCLSMLENLTQNQVIEVVDSLADQIVTSVGVLNMLNRLGFTKGTAEEILAEVNNSNWSKFKNGQAVFDENGKIEKSEDYVKPDLKKFVCN